MGGLTTLALLGIATLIAGDIARSAHPIPSPVALRVGFIERVASLAMRLTGVHGRKAETSQDVDTTRDRFQMGGINAAVVATNVVNGESVRKAWVNEVGVGKSVSTLPFGGGEYRIATALIPCAQPLPAIGGCTRDGNLREKPFDSWGSLSPPWGGAFGERRIAVTPPAIPMLAAPRMGGGRVVAVWNATLGLHRKVPPFVATRPDAHTSGPLSIIQEVTPSL